ncbi:MAG: putative porin [Pseudomonadota bacterium]
MKKILVSFLFATGLAGTCPSLSAAEVLSPVEDTVRQLLERLVQQGTLSAAEGEALRQRLMPAAGSPSVPAPAPGDIRVPYVPEIVKDEIRGQVRNELRQDVVQDVLSQAKQERWGLPGVVPAWVERIKLKGDLRLRAQGDFYADDNAENVYLDFLEVNDAGGIGNSDDPFLNVSNDRQRLRLRARLAVNAKVNDQVQAGLRVATGGIDDPVSTNQTMGRYGGRYTLTLDQAYLRYDGLDDTQYSWITLLGGRMSNPWVSTDLVWDQDLNFEGLAATLRQPLRSGEGLYAEDEINKHLFLTVGVFPLQEVALSSDDKWLLGAQVGGEWLFNNQQSKFTLALAYYDYQNLAGQRNEVNSTLLDFTAPSFLQKGNTLFDIRNDNDPNSNLWALAADYRELNLTALLDMAYFSPSHLWLTLDYVKNIGYDEDRVATRTGAQVEGKTAGYQAMLSVGWPQIAKRGDWRLSVAYKYLERDAVVDAFTDSDFHLGGSDAKGYILGGEYGIGDDTWLSARWLSADAVDGPPLGIDVLQLDVNARF